MVKDLSTWNNANLKPVTATLEQDSALGYVEFLNTSSQLNKQLFFQLSTFSGKVESHGDNSKMGYWSVRLLLFDSIRGRLFAAAEELHYGGQWDLVTVDPSELAKCLKLLTHQSHLETKLCVVVGAC